jgi:hypothetical protein
MSAWARFCQSLAVLRKTGRRDEPVGLFFSKSRDFARKWADSTTARARFSPREPVFPEVPRLSKEMDQLDERAGSSATESRDFVRNGETG